MLHFKDLSAYSNFQGLPGTNALVCYENPYISDKKSFIPLAHSWVDSYY